LQMSADILPVNATNKEVSWSVTNETGSATINATGLLTAVSNGTVRVRATANDGSNVYGQLQITISGQIPVGVAPAITGATEMTLKVGYAATSTETYIITGTEPVTVTKTSGAASIAWNDATKKLDIAAGLAAGIYPVVLTASNGVEPDATLTFTLTVTEEPVTPAVISVTVSPSTPTVKKGTTQQFAANVMVAGDASTSVTWSISGHNLTATGVSASGLLTIAAGETATTLTVRATSVFDNTKFGTATVTVESITNTETLPEANPLRAWIRNGALHVTGLTVGELMSVYSASGALVYQSITASEEANIPLRAQGMYIVRNDDRAVRVAFE